MFVRSPNWETMTYDQREGLDMIANKIARILNGDPNYADSWHDIAGYATLVEKRIEQVEREKATQEANRKADEYWADVRQAQAFKPPLSEIIWVNESYAPHEVTFEIPVPAGTFLDNAWLEDNWPNNLPAFRAMAGMDNGEVLGIHTQWPEGEVDTMAPEVRDPCGD